MTQDEKYGYEWDAMLNGGPADGCLDRVINIEGDKPPKVIIRLIDGKIIKRESLGEKLIEKLTQYQMDALQKVSVYGLKRIDANERCFYNYIETMKMQEYRNKYENVC